MTKSLARQLRQRQDRIERLNEVEGVLVEHGEVDVDTVADELSVDTSTARRWIDEARNAGRVEISGTIPARGGIEDEFIYRLSLNATESG